MSDAFDDVGKAGEAEEKQASTKDDVDSLLRAVCTQYVHTCLANVTGLMTTQQQHDTRMGFARHFIDPLASSLPSELTITPAHFFPREKIPQRREVSVAYLTGLFYTYLNSYVHTITAIPGDYETENWGENQYSGNLIIKNSTKILIRGIERNIERNIEIHGGLGGFVQSDGDISGFMCGINRVGVSNGRTDYASVYGGSTLINRHKTAKVALFLNSGNNLLIDVNGGVDRIVARRTSGNLNSYDEPFNRARSMGVLYAVRSDSKKEDAFEPLAPRNDIDAFVNKLLRATPDQTVDIVKEIRSKVFP